MRAWPRNSLLACAIAVVAGVVSLPPARAVEPLEIRWEQLIPAPPRHAAASNLMATILPHRQASEHAPMSVLPQSDLVFAYDSRRIRITGFALPFNNDELPYKRLLLIPFSGARQVSTAAQPGDPHLAREGHSAHRFRLSERVTGAMTVAPTETDIAKIGYRIAAETIEPAE